MELMVLMYIIIGGMVLFSLGIFILAIAGKDIIFAIYRFIWRRGSDVFLANSNRQISQYFRIAKDGVFKIDGKMYITNPNKIENLAPNMQTEVKKGMDLKITNLNRRIDHLEKKKEQIDKNIKLMEPTEENIGAISGLRAEYQQIENFILTLRDKLNHREQKYYVKGRPAYFYIEGDPVPKDFYEYYTELDSITLENIISRAQTKDPKSIASLEKNVDAIKKLLLIVLLASIIGAWFAFRNNGMLTQLATAQGVALTI